MYQQEVECTSVARAEVRKRKREEGETEQLCGLFYCVVPCAERQEKESDVARHLSLLTPSKNQESEEKL